jgi:hypothetical protein
VAQAAGQAASAVGGWLAATARRVGDFVASGVQAVRRGACLLYVRLMTSRIAKVVGIGGLIAGACYLGHPALAGAIGGAALAVAAAVSQLPSYVRSRLSRTASSQ